MTGKHNKELTPIARRLRKDMTKEERHLWYDFLRGYPHALKSKRDHSINR